jgi:cobalt/nickel transport system ATP-binding protein
MRRTERPPQGEALPHKGKALGYKGEGLGQNEVAPVILVRGLRYRYDDGTVALDGVDFRMFPGETVALFGPNGSGKTTFAHHLNGLLVGEGFVSVCGLRVEKKNFAEIRRKVGMVFQDSDEQLFMPTVLEDAAFGPLNLGRTPEEAVAAAIAALRQVRMEHTAGKAPYHLSAGEKKRVALAGVLAMDPEVLILDEPTTFLDPPAQRELTVLLRRLPQAKIVITHDARFALALGGRGVFFDKGRIVGEGAVGEVVERFGWS